MGVCAQASARMCVCVRAHVWYKVSFDIKTELLIEDLHPGNFCSSGDA